MEDTPLIEKKVLARNASCKALFAKVRPSCFFKNPLITSIFEEGQFSSGGKIHWQLKLILK
jgi:hypothetical protein